VPAALSDWRRARQDFCRHAAARGIATMASGGAPPMYRFYFHAQPAAGAGRILVEAIVSKPGALASVTIKADDAALGEPFAALFRACIDGPYGGGLMGGNLM